MLVGRRLKISYIRDDCKYPKLLPKKGKVSNLIKKHCHNKVAHGGREFTLNDIQGAVYWIVWANFTVTMIPNCVECRWFRITVGEQKTGNLPACRSEKAAPFPYYKVDMFGLLTVKQRRSSRAVHIEVTCFFNKDSFILALWLRYQKIWDQSTQKMEVISLVLNENWRKYIWRWMTGNFNLSCKSKMVTGLDDKRILLWQDRFAQQEPFWDH